MPVGGIVEIIPRLPRRHCPAYIMYIHNYIVTHTPMHASTHTHTHTQQNTRTHTHTQTHTHTSISMGYLSDLCVCVCVYVCHDIHTYMTRRLPIRPHRHRSRCPTFHDCEYMPARGVSGATLVEIYNTHTRTDADADTDTDTDTDTQLSASASCSVHASTPPATLFRTLDPAATCSTRATCA